MSSGLPHMLVSNQRGRGHEPVTVLGSIEIAGDGERHGRIAYANSAAVRGSAVSRFGRDFPSRGALGYDSLRMATSTQKLAVVLAFVAAALSFAAVAVGYARTGEIRVTPLGGGAVMLALGVSGYKRITTPRP